MTDNGIGFEFCIVGKKIPAASLKLCLVIWPMSSGTYPSPWGPWSTFGQTLSPLGEYPLIFPKSQSSGTLSSYFLLSF